MKVFSLLILSLFLTLSCEKGNKDNTNPDDPTDLNVDVVVYQDGSGIVVINATANNASEFSFLMGEDGADTIVKPDGYLEYTYQTSGAYNIEVRAYGHSGRYLKQQKTITVPAEDPVSVGEGYVTPFSYPDMELVWNDEFQGNTLNTNDWSYDIGNGCPDLCGWGNNELEYYKEENCWVGNGVLTIEARKEEFAGYQYTSSKIVTRNKQSFQYGRIDIRATLPKGQGIWPALWMLGINQTSVGWPKCGEIDIMEMIGGSGRENRITGNMFWDNNGVADHPMGHTLASGTYADEFHVFSITWDETEVNWFVNDQKFHTINITGADKTEFHAPFYLIFNVAVGGNWPGSPDATTVFPTQMQVDYIRVFQDK